MTFNLKISIYVGSPAPPVNIPHWIILFQANIIGVANDQGFKYVARGLNMSLGV